MIPGGTIFGGVALFLPAVMLAQATFRGQVVDTNRKPLPGVRVTLSSEAGRSHYAFSTPQGDFNFPPLEPGSYRMLAEKDGYYPLRSIEQLGGSGEEVTLTMEAARELNESVEVTAPPVALDMDTTSAKRVLTDQEIVNVPYPNTNDFRAALRTIPGVVRDARGGLHVNGAAEDQVLFTLNGFNLNDPLTGRFDSRVSVESVQSVEITSGNLPAEFGKGSGGTLAIRSHSGDDKLRYSATNFFPGFENRKGWTIGDWTPRAGVSGPIRRGRAWWSNSADVQYNKTVVRELPKGDDRYSGLRLGNLLTGQVNITPSHILHAGLLINHWNAGRTGLTAIDPRETTIDRRSRQWFFHIKDQIYLGKRTLIEAGYAANRTFAREIPQGYGLLQFTPDGKRGHHYIDGTRTAARDQFLVSAFLPSFELAGSHQLKTGVDLNHVSYWQDMRRTGFEFYSSSGLLMRQTVFGGSGLARRTNQEAAMFVQDSWRVRPGLLLEAGVRGDWDRLVGQWSPSPRFGVAWSPPNWSDTKLYGGVARVTDATNLRIFTRPLDQHYLTRYFRPDGSAARGPALSIFQIGNPLDRPGFTNWTLGAAHRFAQGVTVRADLMRRRGSRGFTYRSLVRPGIDPVPEWAVALDAKSLDAVYDLFNERADAFDSISVTVRHAIRRQYEWLASYTRSRAVSNAVVDVSTEEPLAVTNNFGPLPWDSPHRFMGWGYLPLPWLKNWAVAYLVDARTGFPYSVQNDQGSVVGGVNAQRFPVFFEMNLHFERRFVFRQHRWAFRFGSNNLTDRINPDTVNPFSRAGAVQFYGGNRRAFNFRIRWLGRVT